MKKIRAKARAGSITVKVALATGFLSLPIAALLVAAGIIRTLIAQTSARTWIAVLALLYTRYVSGAPEPLLLVMVGWGMILFSTVARTAARKGTSAKQCSDGFGCAAVAPGNRIAISAVRYQ